MSIVNQRSIFYNKPFDAARVDTIFAYESTFLWADIWRHIRSRPEGCVRVFKCEAHKSWQNIDDPRQRWMAFANEQTDAAAKRVILHDNKTHHRWLQTCVNKEELKQQRYKEWIDYVVAVSEYFVDNTTKTNKKVEQTQKSSWSADDPTLLPTSHPVINQIRVSKELCFSFVWSPVFLWRLTKWANNLQWCPTDNCRCGKDISFVELYVDFMIFTKSRAPICFQNPKGWDRSNRSVWKLQDLDVEADSKGVQTLGMQVNVFTRAVKFLIKEKFLHWPENHCAVAKSLAIIGFSSWHRGISCRPVLACGQHSAITLRRYLISESGNMRDLKHPLAIPGAPLDPPSCVKCEHTIRIPFLKKGFSHFTNTSIASQDDLALH